MRDGTLRKIFNLTEDFFSYIKISFMGLDYKKDFILDHINSKRVSFTDFAAPFARRATYDVLFFEKYQGVISETDRKLYFSIMRVKNEYCNKDTVNIKIYFKKLK